MPYIVELCHTCLLQLRHTNAKAKGVRIGRPALTKDQIPAIFYKHYPAYKNKQLNISELARVCGMSRTTIYKYLELLEK